MIVLSARAQPFARAAIVAALLLSGAGLTGCADMGDGMLSAFADPAKYDLYDCKQLETERKNLGVREAELQGLMAKADTGVAGPVVSELAYRNDYISVRAQLNLANQVWQRNKCVATPVVAAAPAAPATPAAPPPRDHKGKRSQAGGAIY